MKNKFDPHYSIGIDIGGTKIAFVLTDQNGLEKSSYRLDTLPEQGANAVIQRLVQGIEYLMQDMDDLIAGIGIGCPGLIDSQNGIVHLAANLNWNDFPLVAELKKKMKLDLPIYLENDVRAAALGERVFGAAKNLDNFVYIAIGTGLGACAIHNQQVIYGHNFVAMEVGHVSLDPNGRPCNCGNKGCVERYVSGSGLIDGLHEYYADYPESSLNLEATTYDILQEAQKEDPLALRLLDEAGEALGIVFAWCVMILNPSVFVIGGGIGQSAKNWLIPRAKEEMQRRALTQAYDGLEFRISEVESTAIGASALVWHYRQQEGLN
ncbi:ROK family glucokinase [Anaerolineales bacterium]